jgi:hypothetical protein
MTNRFERARDLRQLRFMLSALRAYEEGASNLPRLLEDIDELLLMLSDDNPKWKQRFVATRTIFAKNPKKGASELKKLLEAEIKRRERELPSNG